MFTPGMQRYRYWLDSLPISTLKVYLRGAALRYGRHGGLYIQYFYERYSSRYTRRVFVQGITDTELALNKGQETLNKFVAVLHSCSLSSRLTEPIYTQLLNEYELFQLIDKYHPGNSLFPITSVRKKIFPKKEVYYTVPIACFSYMFFQIFKPKSWDWDIVTLGVPIVVVLIILSIITIYAWITLLKARKHSFIHHL